MPVVLVSFGYAPQPPHEFAPEAVIDHFDELAPGRRRLLARSRAPAPLLMPAGARAKPPHIRLISTGVLSTKSHSRSPL